MTDQTTKHYPGPWWVDDLLWIRAAAPDDDEEFENYIIAEVQFSGDDPTPKDEADARLIAASPLMLEALQMVEWIHIEQKGTFCPFCIAHHPIHDDDCKLDATIKAATETT